MIVVSKGDECSTPGSYLSYYNVFRDAGQDGVRLIVLPSHSHSNLLDLLRGYKIKDDDDKLLTIMKKHLAG